MQALRCYEGFIGIDRMYYHAMHKSLDCDFDSTLLSFYTDKPINNIPNDIHVLRECIRYAKQKVFETKVLTAVDLLKINSTIVDSDKKILDDDNVPSAVLVNDIWSILHDLYNPDKRYPLLLEAAVAAYRLLTLQLQWNVDLWTLCILLEAVFPEPENLKITGISLQWLVRVDPEKPLSAYDAESAVLLILSIFESIWRYNCEIYLAMREKEKEIHNIIQNLSPKLYTSKVLAALTDNLCLSNISFRQKTGVSHGTAVNYLNELERIGVLYSQIVNKERLYFNKIFCDFAREQLQVI